MNQSLDLVLHESAVNGVTSFLGVAGSAGTTLQVILNTVIILMCLGMGIFCLIKIIHNAKDISSAKTPEEKKDAVHSLMWPILGLILALAAPAIALSVMNIFGTATEISADDLGTNPFLNITNYVLA